LVFVLGVSGPPCARGKLVSPPCDTLVMYQNTVAKRLTNPPCGASGCRVYPT